jgi:aspartate-semialdehyde dehydrogenase
MAKNKKYNIAVAGATGNVGREMLQTLAERQFPVDKVYALASKKSVGREVSFGEDAILKVEDLDTFDFSKTEIALFSPGGKVSAIYAPKAAAAGCVVIDNTSHFRMEADIPLIVPEVNAHALGDYKKRNIIANPNCSTIQMVVALKPLHDLATITRVVVSTYQSVSGAGHAAMDELFNQTRHVFVNQPLQKEVFRKEIAFNVIPHIDVFMEDGYTKEEWKMRMETKKILDPRIDVTATCVRVPVFIAHAEAVYIECEKPINVVAAKRALQNFDGVVVLDHHHEDGFVTPKEAAGEDAVYVSRIRQEQDKPNTLSLWIVADNIRKGAALNSVQIAEKLIKDYL